MSWSTSRMGSSGASSSNGHVAVIENPSHHSLIDIDALDLVHVYLNSVALNEAVRINDAAVRDHNLVRPADEPRRNARSTAKRKQIATPTQNGPEVLLLLCNFEPRFKFSQHQAFQLA